MQGIALLQTPQASRAESSSAIVDLPDPDSPMTTRIGGLPRCARTLSSRWTPVASATKTGSARLIEKPAFHHADDSPNALLQSRRIGNAAEIAIKNAVPAVGNEGRPR